MENAAHRYDERDAGGRDAGDREDAQRPQQRPRQRPQQGTLGLCGILLLSLLLSLVWSHMRLMWNDEFLSFYSDSVATFRDVLRVQTHTPISLDPPAYHLLSHAAMSVLGRTATALRLPTMLGFLLLETSLFLLVRRIAGHRAALIAAALPLCTASFRYSVEGRPYGLLLGLYAASVLCWFIAAQRASLPQGVILSEAKDPLSSTVPHTSASPIPKPQRSRLLPLIGLALSIALAINSHYFGVLILLPVAVAEAIRTLNRRRLDPPMLGAFAAGAASAALILPGKAALKPYQHHYYTSAVNLRNVSQGYRELFIHYNEWPMPLQRIIAAVLAVAAIALVIAVARRYKRRPAQESSSLWAALLTLALLPFFGYLFGKFVTHTMEVRYVIAALIPFAVSIALLLERRLRSTRFFYAALIAVLLFGTLLNAWQIAQDHTAAEQALANLQQVPASLDTAPNGPIYIQTLSDFFLRSYYTADPALRARYVLLYDADREFRWTRHDTNAVTAEYMQHFAPLRTASYRKAASQGSALMLVSPLPSGWNWLQPELAHSPDLHIDQLGTSDELRLLRVTWPAADPIFRHTAATAR